MTPPNFRDATADSVRIQPRGQGMLGGKLGHIGAFLTDIALCWFLNPKGSVRRVHRMIPPGV